MWDRRDILTVIASEAGGRAGAQRREVVVKYLGGYLAAAKRSQLGGSTADEVWTEPRSARTRLEVETEQLASRAARHEVRIADGDPRLLDDPAGVLLTFLRETREVALQRRGRNGGRAREASFVAPSIDPVSKLRQISGARRSEAWSFIREDTGKVDGHRESPSIARSAAPADSGGSLVLDSGHDLSRTAGLRLAE